MPFYSLIRNMPINQRSCVKISLFFLAFSFSYCVYKQSSNLSLHNMKVSKVYKSMPKDYEKQNILDEKKRIVKSDIKLDLVTKSLQESDEETLKNEDWVMKRESFRKTLQDSSVRKIVKYELGNQRINWVEWENECVLPTNLESQFKSFSPLVCPGSNAIDIGAHTGDTAVAIAVSTEGGITYAYEPHPRTYHVLNLQKQVNPSLNLITFNIALMKDTSDKMWWNGTGDGCNGSIQKNSCGKSSPKCVEIKSEDVSSHFNSVPDDFLDKLSFIKVDTEGNDKHILRGLKTSVLRKIRPLILMEWYALYKGCNKSSRDMFRAIKEIGYKPYGFSFKLKRRNLMLATCHNYYADLLLLPKEIKLNQEDLQICPYS